VTQILRVIAAAMRNVFKKNLSDASMFENFGQLCLVIDEVISEVHMSVCILVSRRYVVDRWRMRQGVVEAVDKDHIRKGTKNKVSKTACRQNMAAMIDP
jgi:hypothetical protein